MCQIGEAQRKVISFCSPIAGPADVLGPSVVAPLLFHFQQEGRDGLAIADAPWQAESERRMPAAFMFSKLGFPRRIIGSPRLTTKREPNAYMAKRDVG